MRDIGVIDRSGFSLRYVVEGSGPTMLVIGSSLYYQRTFSQNLRQHFRMVFLDHKGFAPASGVFSEDIYSLDILLDDIEFARNQLGLGATTRAFHQCAIEPLGLPVAAPWLAQGIHSVPILWAPWQWNCLAAASASAFVANIALVPPWPLGSAAAIAAGAAPSQAARAAVRTSRGAGQRMGSIKRGTWAILTQADARPAVLPSEFKGSSCWPPLPRRLAVSSW